MSSTHSRSVSSDTTSSSSSAYQFILEHILSYPGTYDTPTVSRAHELPLRSMYSLNSAAPSLSGTATPTSCDASPILPGFPVNNPPHERSQTNRTAAAVFRNNIMDQIAQLPQQPASLPPAFVTSFLNRCFPIQLDRVDFPQALTALDYLKDLEMRRRKEVTYTLKRHDINMSLLHSENRDEELAKWNPSIAEWFRSLESKEKRADALYTQLYVALRRWVSIDP